MIKSKTTSFRLKKVNTHEYKQKQRKQKRRNGNKNRNENKNDKAMKTGKSNNKK